MKRPPEGLTLRVELVKVQDADTIYVKRRGSRFVYHIRLDECWAPENKTEAGDRATAFARSVVAKAKKLYLTIGLGKLNGDLVNVVGKLTTMGRVLGHIWIDDNTTLSEVMVKNGHATVKKQRT
jgi:endonuclease YncB( thermonuclease family)